jgi:hypothetical protein
MQVLKVFEKSLNCVKSKESLSLRSRRYSQARENGKLEIPPAQKLHILSSPAAGWRSILIGQNVDFEFLIDRSKELE